MEMVPAPEGSPAGRAISCWFFSPSTDVRRAHVTAHPVVGSRRKTGLADAESRLPCCRGTDSPQGDAALLAQPSRVDVPVCDPAASQFSLRPILRRDADAALW